jgi:mannose-6-phosphate isomerase
LKLYTGSFIQGDEIMVDYILKLKPFYSPKVWGYEKWNLSAHKNGNSVVENRIYKGKNLGEVLEEKSDFPILVKVINANETLSVQVHPDEDYAKTYENDNGKTECWYILEVKEGATLISGIKKGFDKNKLKQIIDEGKIEDYLERVKVKSGDLIYIPSGTVHAIEGGIKLIEVQRSSDITYRLYDWGRGREVHIKKALDVIDYEGKNKGGKIENFKKLETPYFTIEKVSIKGSYEDKVNEKFHSYTVISGSGYIVDKYEKVNLKPEETVYIPNGLDYKIEGNLELIKAYVDNDYDIDEVLKEVAVSKID